MKKFKKFIPSLVFSLLSLLLVYLIRTYTVLIDGLELKSYDFFLQMKSLSPGTPIPRRYASLTDIQIVTLDDTSLQVLASIVGRWPWPRGIHAKFIENVARYNPSVIFFDVFFPEPQLPIWKKIDVLLQNYGIDDPVRRRIIFTFPSYRDLIQQVRRICQQENLSPQDTAKVLFTIDMIYGNNDEILGKATAQYGIVMYDFFFNEMPIEERPSYYKKALDIAKKFSIPTPENCGLINWVSSVNPPVPEISKGALAVAQANIKPDFDGINRHMPLFVRYIDPETKEDRLFPSIDVMIYLYMNNLSLEDVKIDFPMGATKGYIYLGKTKIPVDPLGRMRIDFVAGTSVFQNYAIELPYVAFLPRELLPEGMDLGISPEDLDLEGKIVLVGSTAPGLYDIWNSPLGLLPGIEHHANALVTMFSQSFITMVPSRIYYLLFFLFALLLAFLFQILKPLSALGSFALIIVGLVIGAYLKFQEDLVFFSYVPLVFQGALAYISTISYRLLTEEKEKRQIKGAFEKYVPPSVVSEILKDPSKLALGGERRYMTVLFSDIRSFTTYSEKHSPEEVVAILNEYLTEMTKIIFEEGGTLDKYVGDEIMALFGAPIYSENHAIKACKTGVKMILRLRELQNEWKSRGIDPFDIGVGINTGEMVVGNMGSEMVMDYTVIGDSVNLGARVEALTRKYNCHIIITEFTYNEVRDRALVQLLDAVVVKGKTEPVKIYQLYGLRDENGQEIIIEEPVESQFTGEVKIMTEK